MTSKFSIDKIKILANTTNTSNMNINYGLNKRSPVVSLCLFLCLCQLKVYACRSGLVRAFAHGAMGRRIDPSWGGPIELFNDALNTFKLRLYGVEHMVKDHSDRKRGKPSRHMGYSFR